MTEFWFDDDDQLGATLREAREVPPRFVDIGRGALAWRNVDAELAALTFDSAAESEPAGTRAEPAIVRALTFTSGELTIELEVADDALLGQVVPPRAGEIEVQSPSGPSRTAPIDDVGWFAIRPKPVGMFRLQVRSTDGPAVLTEWISLNANVRSFRWPSATPPNRHGAFPSPPRLH